MIYRNKHHTTKCGCCSNRGTPKSFQISLFLYWNNNNKFRLPSILENTHMCSWVNNLSRFYRTKIDAFF
jgi:hypothetical protein